MKINTKKIYLVLMVASLFIVTHASAQLPVGDGTSTPGGGTPGGGTSVTLPNPLGVSNVNDLIGKIIDGLIVFATPVAAAMVVWAAYLFMTSAGEPDKITTARNALLWTVVGYAILLLAKGIGLIITNFLGQ